MADPGDQIGGGPGVADAQSCRSASMFHQIMLLLRSSIYCGIWSTGHGKWELTSGIWMTSEKDFEHLDTHHALKT